jgi:ribosomal protein S18 acetylase RimI-like enzyme
MPGLWVRAARSADAQTVAGIQVRAWRRAYRDVLPLHVLAEMTSGAAEAVWRERWSEAVTAAPSPRHRLLVAVEAGPPEERLERSGRAAAEPQEKVTGFAAHAPASDPDLSAERTGELLTLLVDPAYGRRGHGSRLLAATADHLRADGCVTAVTWVVEADEALRAFLAAAGWAPDGTRRALDMGEPVPMLRMHTALRHSPGHPRHNHDMNASPDTAGTTRPDPPR